MKAFQSHWCQDAEQALAAAAGSAEDLAEVQAEVDKHLAQLWRLEGDAVGWLVTRVEKTPAGKQELVLVLGAGRNVRAVMTWAEQLADRHGLDQLRTHIQRPGLQRLYERSGWNAEQIVMRKRLHGQSQQQ